MAELSELKEGDKHLMNIDSKRWSDFFICSLRKDFKVFRTSSMFTFSGMITNQCSLTLSEQSVL